MLLKNFKWALLCITGVLAAACSTATIRSDYDYSADFSTYKTYNFFSPLGTDKAGYSSLITATLKSAVDREMQARGYTKSEQSPSLIVNFSANKQEKTDTVTEPVGPIGIGGFGDYYGYRTGFYQPWAGYGYDTQTVNYTEGTLNIDIVDAARKQLVWEGVATGEVRSSTDQVAIDKLVTKMFAKYPLSPTLPAQQ